MSLICFTIAKLHSRHFIHIITRTAVDLAYKVHGKGSFNNDTPVIVIHGLLGMKKNWESVSKNINESINRSVVAVDVRNHGHSPHTATHTYPELAADISKLMEKLSIKRADIIGHSMGGRTGMALALTEQSKVNRLVVVDISPVSTAGVLNNFFPKLIDVMISIDFQDVENISQARSKAKAGLVASGIVEADTSGFLLMNVGFKPDNTIGWLCNLQVLKDYFTDIANFPKDLLTKKFDRPTLFVGGGESNYIPHEDLPGIRNLFPNVQVKYVANVGHNVHAEDPKSFLNIVIPFLSKS
ncbi:protein ABHD11-like [Leptidea sinapis]|uniref:protein ABHD11-like n=1 Tax=Leptidea sinapis TaxID=189913 RepID=UPI002134D4D0|nr:protein ABHD11-like [Leptidea sinapis]